MTWNEFSNAGYWLKHMYAFRGDPRIDEQSQLIVSTSLPKVGNVAVYLVLTRTDVALHANVDGEWIGCEDKVYDFTKTCTRFAEKMTILQASLQDGFEARLHAKLEALAKLQALEKTEP